MFADLKSILKNYSDRIEAAHKREIVALNDKIHRLQVAAQTPYVTEGLEVICDADVGEMQKPDVEVAVSKTETTTPTCEKSLQVGNSAKMREALGKIKECYENDYLSLDRDPGDVLGNAALLAENALSAPPRNCDRFATEEDAWDAFSSARIGADSSTEEYEKWLFAETKGEAK